MSNLIQQILNTCDVKVLYVALRKCLECFIGNNKNRSEVKKKSDSFKNSDESLNLSRCQNENT